MQEQGSTVPQGKNAAARAFDAVDVPDQIKDNLSLFLRLVSTIIKENDPSLLATFENLLAAEADLYNKNLDTKQREAIFEEAVGTIDLLPTEQATLLMRAFATFFHWANM